jgi:6-phosphogluconolactonase (cycloisomerase 2 family)
VLIYQRAADGTLTPAGMVATGGMGSGGGAKPTGPKPTTGGTNTGGAGAGGASGPAGPNQGAVVLSSDNHWLFAVNTGSSDISSFAVGAQGLTLVDKVPSGGVNPVSLTTHGNWLYAVTGGGTNNISGFTISDQGKLAPLPNSTRPLSTASSTEPAQIQFSPGGDLLVVTERNTNMVDTYTVGADGLATGPISHPSVGMNPFGMAFGKNGVLVVAEGFLANPNGSAVSSYLTAPDGSLKVITASATTHQSTACWVVITNDDKYAYVTNTQSSNISGYRIADDGSLSLLNADGITAATAGSAPQDIALSSDSKYLYVLNFGLHAIGIYRVEANGSLTSIGSVEGLPTGINGLIAW